MFRYVPFKSKEILAAGGAHTLQTGTNGGLCATKESCQGITDGQYESREACFISAPSSG